jgi:hypothetical protein
LWPLAANDRLAHQVRVGDARRGAQTWEAAEKVDLR